MLDWARLRARAGDSEFRIRGRPGRASWGCEYIQPDQSEPDRSQFLEQFAVGRSGERAAGMIGAAYVGRKPV